MDYISVKAHLQDMKDELTKLDNAVTKDDFVNAMENLNMLQNGLWHLIEQDND